MHNLNRIIAKYLREVADKFEAGTSEITESQAIDIFRIVAHEPVSKEKACNFLNLSRSRFDDLIREKKIPKGRKVVGWKELVWWKDELEMCNKEQYNRN